MVLYQGMALAGFSQALALLLSFYICEPQRGGLSQPRPTAWVKRGPPSQPALKGRVPQSHTRFVVLHLLFLQKPPIFVLETHHPMLFFLPFHIRGHRIHLRRAHGKAAIAVLPIERP